MTTIIGVEYEDKAVMACDNLIHADTAKYEDERMSKITERNGYFIGVAGDVALCNIINHIWSPPKPTLKDKDLYKFVVTKVVPSLKALVTPDKKDDMSFNVLLMVKGRLFEIDEDFATTVRKDGIYGIGSGGDYAMGALDTGASLEDAILTASKFDPKTGGLIRTFTQDRS